MSETAPVAPSTTCTLGSIQQQLSLINDFYTNFENAGGGSGGVVNNDGTQLKTALNTKFSNCKEIIKDVNKIADAYVHACMQNDPIKYKNNESCEFFYFWLGDKYGKDLKTHKLSELLDKISETLGNSSWSSGKKCDFKYNDLKDKEIDQTIFDHMKIIFDYFSDYEGVQNELSRSGATCAEKWSTYWTKLSTACKAMEKVCSTEGGGDHTNKRYCTDFKNTYAVHCYTANLPQQMTKLITQIQRAADAAQTAATLAKDEAVRAATTTSSISSIFGTLATIGAPFLLYKVKYFN
ncbi:KIR protein [Plasmodium coatneyi]|uniref:KIR protein n=1 Tax=Plasmodium coatneyi TaxID=208452 RepID=A0A1B1E770_9APIC|nr:KIR protein [Plasmodium coatneyi]ANQ10876.1 KIR protein [Plasmodium coatneyi]